MTIDPALQAQIDVQILEQGAFVPLEFLLDSGRLVHGDYESWRRRDIHSLDEVLMGSPAKIRAQLESAAAYARSIGLVETPQSLDAWVSGSGDPGGTLRISADARLQRLIGSRYQPPQAAPQMDLFFDNPVVVLINGIARALAARNARDAQRLLDRLYLQAPNHADLAAFDRLLTALERLGRPVDDPRRELTFLQEVTPTAKRLLGWEARDLLTPLWRQLGDALDRQGFSMTEPNLHRSFALLQAQDWAGAADAVRSEARWSEHLPLCLSLAQSSFYQQRRSDALRAWFHACWLAPDAAAAALEDRRQPDTGMRALWRRFVDSDTELAPGLAAEELELTAADFPAWLLLREPGLNRQLAIALAPGHTRSEEAYRIVHRWIDARRGGQAEEELELRKGLLAVHPFLFMCLKQAV
jgi:hypothetical protein